MHPKARNNKAENGCILAGEKKKTSRNVAEESTHKEESRRLIGVSLRGM